MSALHAGQDGAGPFITDWRQHGHLCFWHYKPMPRMYSGWHFAGDPSGCENLRQLLGLLLGSDQAAYRTLFLTDPRSVGADRIFGAHELGVRYPPKLRISFDPGAPEDESRFERSDDRLDLSLGRTWLEGWRSALSEVARGDGDFGLWFDSRRKDPMKFISFWWWPKS